MTDIKTLEDILHRVRLRADEKHVGISSWERKFGELADSLGHGDLKRKNHKTITEYTQLKKLQREDELAGLRLQHFLQDSLLDCTELLTPVCFGIRVFMPSWSTLLSICFTKFSNDLFIPSKDSGLILNPLSLINFFIFDFCINIYLPPTSILLLIGSKVVWTFLNALELHIAFRSLLYSFLFELLYSIVILFFVPYKVVGKKSLCLQN